VNTLATLGVLLCSTGLAFADAATGPDVFVEDTPVRDPHDTGRERFVLMSLMSAPDGQWFGLHLQVDFLTLANLSLGASGSVYARGVDVLGGEQVTMDGLGYVAYTAHLHGRFKLRVQAGYGMAKTFGADLSTREMVSTVFPVVEAAALLTVRANHDWAFVGGPLVRHSLGSDESTSGTNMTSATGTSVMLILGLERRF
jgi:hypothetical protein